MLLAPLFYMSKFVELLHEGAFVQSEAVTLRDLSPHRVSCRSAALAPSSPGQETDPPCHRQEPSSKAEVCCGECSSRIFVVSAILMPPSSLPDRASYSDSESSSFLHDLQLSFPFKQRLLHVQC